MLAVTFFFPLFSLHKMTTSSNDLPVGMFTLCEVRSREGRSGLCTHKLEFSYSPLNLDTDVLMATVLLKYEISFINGIFWCQITALCILHEGE